MISDLTKSGTTHACSGFTGPYKVTQTFILQCNMYSSIKQKVNMLCSILTNLLIYNKEIIEVQKYSIEIRSCSMSANETTLHTSHEV